MEADAVEEQDASGEEKPSSEYENNGQDASQGTTDSFPSMEFEFRATLLAVTASSKASKTVTSDGSNLKCPSSHPNGPSAPNSPQKKHIRHDPFLQSDVLLPSLQFRLTMAPLSFTVDEITITAKASVGLTKNGSLYNFFSKGESAKTIAERHSLGFEKIRHD